ncbi:MAG: AAA family ATPase [Deltaproteobacteria bacterium]
MKFRNIYVAATSQHVGKTTCTLGIVKKFQNQGINVGYCKPVGQQFLDLGNLRVDKDIILFSDLLGFEMIPEIHSPVILGKGATERFIEAPDSFDYHNRIINACGILNNTYDVTVFEGTGHPGVGTVTGINNAKVAKLLNAGVIMVVEGGIGNTIDMFHMSTALFREENVPLIGVIINKVIEDKLDKVRQYVGSWLEEEGIPLLGVIPYDQTLAYPVMETIVNKIEGKVLLNNDKTDNRVANVISGSMIDYNNMKNPENLLLLTSSNQVDKAVDRVKMLQYMLKLDQSPLSGIIVTGEDQISEATLEYVNINKIPFVHTHLDTYSSVIKISKIEVKINRHTPWKVQKAIELVGNNTSLEKALY